VQRRPRCAVTHPSNSMKQTEAFIREIQQEFPKFRIVYKADNWLSKVIDVLLRILTLGTQKEYMTRYHTVIGHTLYVPEAWDDTADVQRVITLRHERIHLRQTKRYTWVGMTFLYLIPFFPLGLAYGRARIEWEAYRESVAATAELLGMEAARSKRLKSYIIQQFTCGAYGWMWPFPKQVERWYDQALAEIAQQYAPNDAS
jgi:hypothetical protein